MWRGTRRLLIVSLLGLVALVPTPRVSAHPSDPETLTLDLLLSPQGLEIVDAAVVAATGSGSDEPFPSEQDRRSVATRVLETLGVNPDNVAIDTTKSDRYHEVGFTISLRRPFTNSAGAKLRLDTVRLQRIAGEARLKRLKLQVCDANARDSSDDNAGGARRRPLPFVLEVEASRPGRENDLRQNERPGCEQWVLAPDDAPISLRVGVIQAAPAKKGSDRRTILYIAAAFVGGLGLVAATKRWARERSR